MKALTIQQPYASLIACGAKTIETRSWKTNYRGKLAIHAGKRAKITDDLKDAIDDIFYYEHPIHMSGEGWFADGALMCDELPTHQIIAIADLVDCVEIKEIIPGKPRHPLLIRNEQEFILGDFMVGRYAWILDNIQPIEPVAIKGHQGLWNCWAPIVPLPEGE